jgi:phosphatidylinositol glycan class O
VLSDHGQTLGGDHGGGTPDETDSVLLAVSLRKMHEALQHKQQQAAKQAHEAVADTADGPALPLTPEISQQQHYSTHCQAGSGQAVSSSPAILRLMHTGGYMLTDDAQAQCASSSSSSNGTTDAASCSQQCWPWLCSSSMSQIDLTPTIAHLLGVPIPFGNLGKLPPHLFAALAVNSSSSSDSASSTAGYSTGAWLPQYAAALHANAQQVMLPLVV